MIEATVVQVYYKVSDSMIAPDDSRWNGGQWDWMPAVIGITAN
jgi:hypothetical protein